MSTSHIPLVKQFILDRFLAGEDPSRLTPTTPLVTGGVLDSLGLLELVAFLEKELGIEFQAHEVDATHFDTLNAIDALLATKASRG